MCNLRWWAFEALRTLKTACLNLGLTDSQIQAIFYGKRGGVVWVGIMNSQLEGYNEFSNRNFSFGPYRQYAVNRIIEVMSLRCSALWKSRVYATRRQHKGSPRRSKRLWMHIKRVR